MVKSYISLARALSNYSVRYTGCTRNLSGVIGQRPSPQHAALAQFTRPLRLYHAVLAVHRGNGVYIEFFVFRHSTLGRLTQARSTRSRPEITGGNPSGVLQPAHLEPYARAAGRCSGPVLAGALRCVLALAVSITRVDLGLKVAMHRAKHTKRCPSVFSHLGRSVRALRREGARNGGSGTARAAASPGDDATFAALSPHGCSTSASGRAGTPEFVGPT